MDSIDKESKLKEIKQNLIRFTSKTFKEMKELGITTLNISNSNAILENDDKPFLSSLAITMARNLRELLLNIDKLSDQQSFMMNLTKFTKIESYVQFLLNKLKSSSTKEAFVEKLRCNNDNFLEIGLPPNNENLKDNFEITSEEYVEAEINRRNGFHVVFFKSSSINVSAYECWLKIIETGEIISEEQGYEIYQQKKKEENSLRENILKQVYELAGYKLAEYYYINEESPRYYPDNDNPDNKESPRYYHDNEESILLIDES
ncbi:unnamed protein product [Rhizophagus irregularis]|nr:unnamed protein product [Rhizophagus irregularis]CAB5368583.1 unnamed protein product [Rhizophagus irregularis]